MNVQTNSVRERATAVLKEEQEKAKSKSLKAKLIAVNEACAHIVDKGGFPTVPGVVSWIATNRTEASLSARTIYNDRQKPGQAKERSPYSKVIDAWTAVSNSKQLSSRGREENIDQASVRFISDKELLTISDKVVRHKVALLIGQVNNAQHQLAIYQSIKENPPILGMLKQKDAMGEGGCDVVLSSEELEAISALLKDATENHRGLSSNDSGAIIASRIQAGAKITKPGFVGAIRKILDKYGSYLLE